jgi:hypothetical protein
LDFAQVLENAGKLLHLRWHLARCTGHLRWLIKRKAPIVAEHVCRGWTQAQCTKKKKYSKEIHCQLNQSAFETITCPALSCSTIDENKMNFERTNSKSVMNPSPYPLPLDVIDAVRDSNSAQILVVESGRTTMLRV